MEQNKIKVIVAFFAVIAMSLLAVCFGLLFSLPTEARAADETYNPQPALDLIEELKGSETTITLDSDVVFDLTESSALTNYIPGGRMVLNGDVSGKTLDLGGHTLTIITTSETGCIFIDDSVSFTVQNGKIIGESGGNLVLSESIKANIIVNNVDIEFTSTATETAESAPAVFNLPGKNKVTLNGVALNVSGNVDTSAGANVTIDDNKFYTYFSSAVSAATDGETVKLLKDITTAMPAGKEINANITIDLDTHKITSNDIYAVNVKPAAGKSVTIKNGEIDGRGIKVVSTGEGAAVTVEDIIISRKAVTPPVMEIGSVGTEDSPAYEIKTTLKNVDIDIEVQNTNMQDKIAVEIENADVTMSEFDLNVNGQNSQSGSSVAIPIHALKLEASDATIEDSEIISQTGTALGFLGSVKNTDAAAAGDTDGFNELTIKNSIVTGSTIALSGNASGTYDGTVINIENSKLTANDPEGLAIYHPHYGVLNVSGDTTEITGTTGIEMRAGVLNVRGGKIKATGEFSEKANGGGSTMNGVAVAVSQHTTNLPVTVNISGGELSATGTTGKALYEKDLQDTETNNIGLSVTEGTFSGAVESSNVENFIKSGTFSVKPNETALASGSGFVVGADGSITVGSSSDIEKSDVIKIGNTYYEDLTAAVAAVPTDGVTSNTPTIIEFIDGNGDRVVTGNGVKVQAGQNIIIDYNGFTYNINGETVGSSGTETNGFQLLKGSKVTMKNGTLVSDKAKILIQNYCDLTLENMILDASESTSVQYVVSNNFGNTVIKGSTEIKASDPNKVTKGGYAFDVYYGMSADYYEGVSVTFKDFTGTVEGTVDYSKDSDAPETTTEGKSWEELTKLNIDESVTGTFDIEITCSNPSEASIDIAGGSFTKPVNEAYINDNSLFYPSGSGYTVGVKDEVIDRLPAGTYVFGNVAGTLEDVKAAGAVALNGYDAYATITDAAKEAEADDTITLVADVTDENITIAKGVTLDLSGFTVTGNISIKASDVEITDTAEEKGEIAGAIDITGTAETPIENITLDGITVSGTSYFLASNGTTQVGYVVRPQYAAVEMNNVVIDSEIDETKPDEVQIISTVTSDVTLNNVTIAPAVTGNSAKSVYGVVFRGQYSTDNVPTNDASTFNKLDIIGSTISMTGNTPTSGTTYFTPVSGNGTAHGTIINISDSTLTATNSSAVYHPQYGEITIESSNLTGLDSAIEIRAGKLNVISGNLTATAETFACNPNGSGATTTGAAVAVAQHTTRLPIAVELSGGTFTGVKAFYENDPQDGEIKDVTISITGGTYEGAVESENIIKNFIHGGKFSVAPTAEAFAEGYEGVLYNGYYVVVSAGTTADDIEDSLTSAASEVRAYAATFGLTIAQIEALAEAGDADAAAIITAYKAISFDPTNAASSANAAIDAIDAYINNLAEYKAAAINTIQQKAASSNVTAPTATYSAINNAKTKAEVDGYLSNALDEIDDIASLRSLINTQYSVLSDLASRFAELTGEDGKFGELLTDIEYAISIAQGNILTGTKMQLEEVQKELEATIEKAISSIEISLPEYDTQLGSLEDKLDTLTGALADMNSGLADDIEELKTQLTEIAASIDDIDLTELTDKIVAIDTAVNGIATKVEQAADVETAKTDAAADLEAWLNDYLDSVIASSARTLTASAAEITEDSAVYDKIVEAFGEENAKLVMKYYNDAVSSIENATSVQEVESAVSTFKSQVASIEASSQNAPTFTAVYVLLAIILAVVIAVVIIVIVRTAAKKKEEEPVEEQPEPEAEEEIAPAAEEQPVEEQAEEAPEEIAAEDIGDERERVIITATVRSFEEVYNDLSEELRDLYVRLKDYALTKEGTTEVNLSNGVCVKHGSRKVVRLTVRRGYPVAMFVLENEMLKDVRRNATAALKLKIPATELVIRDEGDFEAARRMIDFTMDQILKDIEEAKERRKAARRARREALRQEKAAEQEAAAQAESEAAPEESAPETPESETNE